MAKQKLYIQGRAGGQAVLEKYGPEHFSKMSSDYQKKLRRKARMAQKGTLIIKKRNK